MKVIEIQWADPFSVEQAKSLHGDTDYGVYQIYGTHNIMGSNSLLYIGLACAQTFGARFYQHENDSWLDWDYPEFQIYVGRLGGAEGCTKEEWDKQIDCVEKVLIDYCQPPFNIREKSGLSLKIENNLVVLNFSKRAKLPYVLSTAWRNSSYEKGSFRAYSNKMYP